MILSCWSCSAQFDAIALNIPAHEQVFICPIAVYNQAVLFTRFIIDRMPLTDDRARRP
jgi:hypothetical protein